MKYRNICAASSLALAACGVAPVSDELDSSKASIAPSAKSQGSDFSAYLDRDPLLPDYRRVELDNGAVLLLLEKPEVPLIGFEAVIRGGATADAPGRSGTASLLAELLRKGAGGRSAAEFAATVEGVGGIAFEEGFQADWYANLLVTRVRSAWSDRPILPRGRFFLFIRKPILFNVMNIC